MPGFVFEKVIDSFPESEESFPVSPCNMKDLSPACPVDVALTLDVLRDPGLSATVEFPPVALKNERILDQI